MSGFSIESNLKAFRRYYPQGKNYVITSDIDKPFERRYEDIVLSFMNINDLITDLLKDFKTEVVS